MRGWPFFLGAWLNLPSGQSKTAQAAGAVPCVQRCSVSDFVTISIDPRIRVLHRGHVARIKNQRVGVQCIRDLINHIFDRVSILFDTTFVDMISNEDYFGINAT